MTDPRPANGYPARRQRGLAGGRAGRTGRAAPAVQPTALEQPVPHAEVDALAELRPRLGIPVMLDESLCGYPDAQAAVYARDGRLFNVRLSKCGGILPSLRIIALAERSGLGVQLGCHPGETTLLSAAGRHVASRVAGLRYVEGSYDRHILAANLTATDLTFGYGGRARPLERAGLGVDGRSGGTRGDDGCQPRDPLWTESEPDELRTFVASDGYPLAVTVWPSRRTGEGPGGGDPRRPESRRLVSSSRPYARRGRLYHVVSGSARLGANQRDRGHTPSPRRLNRDLVEWLREVKSSPSGIAPGPGRDQLGRKARGDRRGPLSGAGGRRGFDLPGTSSPRRRLALEQFKIVWALLTNRRKTFEITALRSGSLHGQPRGASVHRG